MRWAAGNSPPVRQIINAVNPDHGANMFRRRFMKQQHRRDVATGGVADSAEPQWIEIGRWGLVDQPLQRAADISPYARPCRTHLARQPIVDRRYDIATLGQPWPPTLVLPLRPAQPRTAMQAEQCRMRSRASRQIEIDQRLPAGPPPYGTSRRTLCCELSLLIKTIFPALTRSTATLSEQSN